MRRAPFPLATLGLVGAILATFAAERADDGLGLCYRLGFTAAHPSLETALSSLLLHDPSGFAHVLGNVAALVLLGAVVEPELGGARLVALFVAAGLGGCAFHWLVAPGAEAPLVGASGGLMGLAAVGAVIRPRAMLGGVVTYVAINLIALFVSTPLVPPGTSVACHVGGFTVGVVFVALVRLRGVELHRAAPA